MYNIDWSAISNAVDYYTELRYKYIETPWIVNIDDIKLTCPDDDYIIKTNFGDDTGLVGSAEQGFLQMALNGELIPDQKYVSAGPCFRWERPFDELHQLNFMKVELFAMCEDFEEARYWAGIMCRDAQDMLYNISAGTPSDVVFPISTESGTDLMISGIEIGSYGVRRLDQMQTWWAFGTGLAEPRYSQAMAKYNEGLN